MRTERALEEIMKKQRRVERKMESGERTAQRNSLLYASCSALFSVIALLGLFLGYCVPNANVGEILAGGEPILHGSLLGVIVEVFRGSIPAPVVESDAALAGRLPFFLYLCVYELAFSVLCSLALTVAAFLRTGSARSFCLINGFLTLLSYGAVCVTGTLISALTASEFSWKIVDMPSALALLLCVWLYCLVAIAERRGRGVLNVVIFLLTLCFLPTFLFPGTPLLSDLNAVFLPENDLGAKKILLLLLTAFTVFNLVLSVLRLTAKGSFLPDAARFFLQFGAALALLVGYLATGTALGDFFMYQVLPSVFLLLAPLAALIFSAFGASLSSAGVRRANAKAPSH